MDRQRQRSGGGRRRRRRGRAEAAPVEPVLIAARRPNSPLITRPARRAVAASAAPRTENHTEAVQQEALEPGARGRGEASCGQRRAARIVTLNRNETDESELRRQRLLERLMHCETRGAISRAANEYLEAGFEFPEEQPVQLQLLEHFDESRARDALAVLTRLFEEEEPTKVPILTQRLRRLEEYADEEQTRQVAAEFRRSLRT